MTSNGTFQVLSEDFDGVSVASTFHRAAAPTCSWILTWLCLSVALMLPASYLHAQNPVEVPADSPQGVYANIWAERYDGSSEPNFKPTRFLHPNTNYRLVVDVAAIGYNSRPGVVSIPLQQQYQQPVLTQIVIEDERYRSDAKPYFFSVHKYRARESMAGFPWQLNDFVSAEKTPVEFDALTILRSSPYGPIWMLDRTVFLLHVRNRIGEAPLGIVFRAPFEDRVIEAVSMRFCVADPNAIQHCNGLPRESEYMAGAIGSEPPPTPPPSEIEFLPRADAPGHPRRGQGTRTWTWNSWIARQGDSSQSPTERLILEDQPTQSTYVLQIDASLFIYSLQLGRPPSEVGYTTPDRAILELVRDRIQKGDTSLSIVVRAEAVGDVVSITDGQVQKIDVDLTRLNPDTPPQLHGAGEQVTIKELSEHTAGTSIQVDLKPETTGCGAVALSISDENGIRPLDHLVHLLQVGQPSEATVDCAPSGVSSALSAGIHNILAPKGAPAVDAAIHVFELLPDTGQPPAAAAFLVGAAEHHFSWELATPLTEYLSDSGNLETRILEARERTFDGAEHAYDQAAWELAGAIFSGSNPTEQRKADEARAAFQAFVKHAQNPPRVLARLTDWRGNVLFLPLNLLSAPGQRAVLEKPVNVVLPLPVEDFGQSGCLSQWALAVSDTLEGADVTVPDDIKRDASWLGESFDELRNYFTNTVHVDGEGLIVVAHHASGRLRYGPNDFLLQAQEIKREYGQSTAAVLAMCGAGSVNRVENLLIRRLNDFGLDAAILSPFSLDANYGKVFAIEFSRLVRSASVARQEATLEELFREAISATSATMKNHPNPKVRGSVGDMGLELILVGNPMLHLCKE